MNHAQPHVAVIGGGVAGLTAADALAGRGVRISLFEKTPFLGGTAAQLNCKATDACVKCGACVAEDRLQRALGRADVSLVAGAAIDSISAPAPFRVTYRVRSPLVNAESCDGCGICLRTCPVPGAIIQGHPPRGGPPVAICRDRCRWFDNAACTLCRDACPQGAIDLSAEERSDAVAVDAILVATGFVPYDPVDKPYGYGVFPNVITSLDAERTLRRDGALKRPSDDRPIERLAFIQCVGSRDDRLGHNWCSKICCGSSLRMARLLQSRQADVQVTVFYIDVQTFGKDFRQIYPQIRDTMTLIRAIPGEIRPTADDDLEVIYFDPQAHASREASFDAVVLSVGLLPSPDNPHLADMLGMTTSKNGFLPSTAGDAEGLPAGIFTAGAATGPMSIAESVGSAEKAVQEMARYLDIV